MIMPVCLGVVGAACSMHGR